MSFITTQEFGADPFSDLELTARQMLNEALSGGLGGNLVGGGGFLPAQRSIGAPIQRITRPWSRQIDLRRDEADAFAPRYDLCDAGDKYIVDFSTMSNVNKDDIDIEVTEDGRTLILSGEKKLPEHLKKEGEKLTALHSEGVYGRFRRVVNMPTKVKVESVTSKLDKGNLIILLPKDTVVESKKTSKRITVQ